MDAIVNNLVNISPVISLLIGYSLYKETKANKNKVILYWGIMNIILSIIDGFALALSTAGFGVLLLVILNSLFLIIIYIFTMILFGIKEKSVSDVIRYFAIIILILFTIFKRLIYDNIINFEFINKIGDKSKYIFSLFHNIFNNEWVKGILIAALGGIIATLTTNKISKEK